jgi:hypothetical protein
MALVSTKKKDSRYSHLEKLYTKDKDEKFEKQEEEISEENDNLPETEKIKFSKKETLKNLLIVFLLSLLGVSGYIFARFL